jgi:hypothetical protein
MFQLIIEKCDLLRLEGSNKAAITPVLGMLKRIGA